MCNDITPPHNGGVSRSSECLSPFREAAWKSPKEAGHQIITVTGFFMILPYLVPSGRKRKLTRQSSDFRRVKILIVTVSDGVRLESTHTTTVYQPECRVGAGLLNSDFIVKCMPNRL